MEQFLIFVCNWEFASRRLQPLFLDHWSPDFIRRSHL